MNLLVSIQQRLLWNWRTILQKAWSMKLMGLSIVLSAAEVAMPYIAPNVRSGAFAGLAALVTLAAGVARLFAQKSLPHE